MLTFFRLLGYLPLPVLHVLGSALGWLVYAVSPTYRKRIRKNLEIAFPGRDTRAIRRRAVAETGKMTLELPRLWFCSLEKMASLVPRVSGWETVTQALEAGRGILFLTPHLGCFEISARYVALFTPITVLYRPPKKKWVRTLVEAGRAQGNLAVATTDIVGIRLMIKALGRGEAVGLLPDHTPRHGEGTWSRFFGRPTYTMTLAGRLSEKNVETIFAFAERLPWGRGYHLHFYRPEVPLTGDVQQRTDQINRMIENLISRYPGQYLWSYNRYNQPPVSEPAQDQ